MRYSDIISKLTNLTATPSFLIKMNLWSFVNIKFFFFKSTSVIFFFLTNLQKFKIRFLKFNNYIIVHYYYVFFILLIVLLYLFL